MDKLVQEIANLVYNQKRIPKEIFEQQMSAYATKLLEGIFIGYDCDFSKKNISPLQLTTLRELEQNAWIFSGFKASKYINELTQTRKALVKDGQIVPFEEFAKFVRSIDNTYNLHYLNAEYNYAVGASRAVAQWEAFQAEKHIFPNLQWDAVLDDRTRDAHRALHGIVKPIDDPFWKIYNIPLDWNCRCDRRQTTADATGDIPKSVQDLKVHPFFKTNVGETKQLFNDKHPYFKCDKDTAISMSLDNCKKTRNFIESIAKTKQTFIKILEELKYNAILALPREKQFKVLEKYDNGGLLLEHRLIKKGSDYERNIERFGEKAKQGAVVELLPEIHFKDIEYRYRVLPNYMITLKNGQIRFEKKNPDARVNGIYWEEESTDKFLQIAKRISRGAEQADNVLISYSSNIDKKDFFTKIKKMFREHIYLQNIEIHGKNTSINFKREDFK